MYFFFYGTLVAGHTNPVARAIHARLRPIGPATLKGRLHAVPTDEGWYPALLRGSGVVHGMLYETNACFEPTDLARLDDYEDFDPALPAESLYLREAVTVTTAQGKTVEAQVYRYNQPLASDTRAIPGGDFAGWLAEHDLPAFASARH